MKISVGLLATGLLAISPVHAETVELRMGDSLPPSHIISENLTKPWIKLVEEKSEGRIKIRYFPAEQMGKAKDMLSLTQSGILDVGYIGAAYVSEKMPLSAVAELPGAFENSCQVIKGYWELATEGGTFMKMSLSRMVFDLSSPPYCHPIRLLRLSIDR
ncbi:hypothetical protein KVP09_04890 [Alcaligenaceae bacterium CGII-47]|nr:hypothetical protein [Alcaligenaceae bacterium CGII-47]